MIDTASAHDEPPSRAPGAAAPGSGSLAPQDRPDASEPAERSILVAEDRDDARKAIAFRLEYIGLKVTTAADGEEACLLAMQALQQGRPYDWILMDMEMPKIDGYEATRILRSHGYDRPIIAMTAHSFDDSPEECRRFGCDAIIGKPIDWNQLTAILTGGAGA
jgi:CheY-like chemotaxis protein